MKGERQVSTDKTPPPQDPMAGHRIAKVLARAGVASRRESERMIAAGRVTLNGKILKTPAVTVTDSDVILVDNEPIAEAEPPRLWRYHKPAGLMTTHKDPEGRPTLFDNLPKGMPRVISVGRLDMTSEGLMLLTNDGELARQLELPSTAWARKYRARAYGRVTQEQLDTLKAGIKIDGIKTGPIEAEFERQQGDNAWINVTIREGKNREVRRALETLELKVNRLIRLAYGPFQLGELPKGEVDEVQRRVLRDQVGHMVDIPKGRPTHAKTGPRTSGRKSAGKALADAATDAPIAVVKKGGRTFGKSSSASKPRAAKPAKPHFSKSKPKTDSTPKAAKPARKASWAKPSSKGRKK